MAANDAAAIGKLLQSRNTDFVVFEDWRRLDACEQAAGAKNDRVRRKNTDLKEMMSVVHKLRQE